MNDFADQPISPRAFERERRARKEAERLLEEKSRELFETNGALEALNLRLEERVAERTAELAVAIDRAEEASRAKTRFLAVMSHELRTPLTSILGYVDLLREPELSAGDRAEFIAVVHRSGEHLQAMIERILQIAQLDGEQEVPELRPLDLPAMLEDAIQRVRPLMSERDLTIELRADEPVPRTVETVGERVRHAVLAILENAVRFTERGGVCIRVGFAHDREDRVRDEAAGTDDGGARDDARDAGGRAEAPGPDVRGPAAVPKQAAARAPAGTPPGRLWIEIADTGPGIDASDQERVFEAFEQVEDGMNRRWDGPGLGLTIARRSAQALGGDVTLRSERGQGAVFRIDVPVAASRGGAWLRFGDHSPLPRRSPRDAAVGRPIEGLRVLVAEDQTEIRWLVRRVLERAGATVLEAGDGDQLVSIAMSSDVDLVVTDLQMPRCDGYAAVRRLRAEGFDRPTIALTAHALGADMREATTAGCDDYLVKPIDPVGLVDACVRWQGRRHRAATLPNPPGSSRGPEPADATSARTRHDAEAEADADRSTGSDGSPGTDADVEPPSTDATDRPRAADGDPGIGGRGSRGGPGEGPGPRGSD